MAAEKIPVEKLVVDAKSLPGDASNRYPPPYDKEVRGRHRHRLAPEVGLTRYGVNLVRLEPGGVSSARHWHSHQDEFVYVLEGEVTLVTDEGETVLAPGKAVGFPAGNPNAHHFLNRSGVDAWYLEIGDRPPVEDVTYPDVDMRNDVRDGKPIFRRKDGSAF